MNCQDLSLLAYSRLNLKEIIFTIPNVLLPILFNLKIHSLNKYVKTSLQDAYEEFTYLHFGLVLGNLAYSLGLIMFDVQLFHLLLMLLLNSLEHIFF